LTPLMNLSVKDCAKAPPHVHATDSANAATRWPVIDSMGEGSESNARFPALRKRMLHNTVLAQAVG
jgi:hypothetical protein